MNGSDQTNIARLVGGRPDADIAAELRTEIRAALEPVCSIIDRAVSHGMQVNFSVGMGPLGKTIVQGIGIVRQL